MTLLRSSSRGLSAGFAAATAAAAAFALLASAGCNSNGGQTAEGGGSSASPAAPAASGGAAPAGGGKTLQIAVIPKGTTHEYWKAIHAGAISAQQEFQKAGTNLDILWKGPLKEDDRNGQIEVVDTFISQKVDGIALAPLDEQALVQPVKDAVSNKIPVVIMDSSLKSSDYVSFVATDNEKGGELGAQQLIKVLGGKKRVLLMRYQQGSASTEQREAGFLKGIKADPTIQLVSSDQYGGATVETAYQTGQNLLSRYGSQVDGIFTPNESTTRGMIRALKDANLLGKVKLVGFDSSPDLNAALKANQVQGLVLQDPFKMGHDSVKALVDSIQGKPVEKRIDTGVTMATPENMDQPDIKNLLSPPLDQYLK